MDLVINEWFAEYLRPDDSQENKKKLETFLIRFMERKDKIFVRNPSAFLAKIYRYSKIYQGNFKIYEPISNIIKLIIQDSERCQFVNEGDINLPEETSLKLQQGNYMSDLYLFESANITQTKLIVTTDGRLCDQMRDDSTFKVILLDDFLNTY